jgi:hypothetical protein
VFDQPSTLNQPGELAPHFARGQRRVIGRQAGIKDRGGHKQALVCFPLPLFYARPPAGTSRETGRARRGPRLSEVRRFLLLVEGW